MNDPFFLGLMLVGGAYVAKWWHSDQRAAQAGSPHPRPLPGAVDASAKAVWIAVAGALALVAIETGGEVALGVFGEQSKMTWLFAAYSVLAAPIIEELMFRGWFIVEHKGRAVMWLAAVGASVVFALAHPFLWRWDDAGFAWTLTTKGCFSSAMVGAMSLWMYVARLATWNPGRSLLPCFAGHAAKNLAVVAVKAATGFMGAAWWRSAGAVRRAFRSPSISRAANSSRGDGVLTRRAPAPPLHNGVMLSRLNSVRSGMRCDAPRPSVSALTHRAVAGVGE